MRRKLYEIIEPAKDNLFSKIYDFLMMAMIVASLVPLAFKETNLVFDIIEYVTVTVFCLDYLLRLFTADLKMEKGVASFFLYPLTPMAIIDLFSILPSGVITAGYLAEINRDEQEDEETFEEEKD